MKPKILAIIPVRGGSKGIPKKNIKPLFGKPLITWTIEQVQKSRYIFRVFVSTDDNEIATIAEKGGVDIPFLRQYEFAQEYSPTSDAIIHTLDTFEKMGEYYDILIILEPTFPLREKDDIDKVIETYLRNTMTMPVEYATIKGGIINFTKYLASYLGKYNIRVNAISPGGIEDHQPASFIKEYSSKVFLGERMARTDDITGVLLFLLSDQSRYITGQNIIVDGGWTL